MQQSRPRPTETDQPTEVQIIAPHDQSPARTCMLVFPVGSNLTWNSNTFLFLLMAGFHLAASASGSCCCACRFSCVQPSQRVYTCSRHFTGKGKRFSILKYVENSTHFQIVSSKRRLWRSSRTPACKMTKMSRVWKKEEASAPLPPLHSWPPTVWSGCEC